MITYYVTHHAISMIQSLSDKDTEVFYTTGMPSKAGWQKVQDVAARKLDFLNAANKLDDLRAPPGNRLKSLTGNRAGQHSIRINDQWRVCFTWTDAGPSNVEISDYH